MNPQSPCPAARRHEMNNCPGRGPARDRPGPGGRESQPSSPSWPPPPCWRRHAAAARHPPGPAAHRMREGQRTPVTRSPTPAACAPTGCRTSPTPTAADRSLRSKCCGNSGSATSRLQAAQRACQAPVAVPGADPGPAAAAAGRRPEVRPVHALPRGAGFPDPTTGPDGRVEFVLSVSRDGFDPHSPQILAKAHECQYVLPAGTGLPSATEAP